MTKKTTLPISEQYPYERVYYTYDLANRLIQVKTEVSDNPTKYVVYTYNDNGIRVRAYSYDQTGSTISNKKTTVYLIDSYNHTGYAQSLEELTFLKANPNLQTDTPRSGRKYVIGDDVISQQSWVLSTISSPRYLLYDGHGSAALTTGGSTRQLAYYTGSDVTIADSYSYDGYGVLLQNESVASSNPGKVLSTSISTNLLYAGEQFDTNSQQYYLRARWYNPLSGLFNSVDPYSGNTSDPQSLHKYLYCHANPVNAIDPSGLSLTSLTLAVYRISFMVMNIALRCLPVLHFATTVAASVMIVMAVQFVLEQFGFVPQTGYTEEILVISAIVFTFGLTLSMFIESFRGIVEPIKNSSQGQIINGNTANQRSPATNPPYKPSSIAAEGKIAPNTDVVRVYREGVTNPAGRWGMPRSEIQGLSPQQIQDKFSLKYTPTHYTSVDASGINARVGITGPNFGFNGEGVQIEFLEEGAKFVNPTPIPPGGF